LDSENTKKGSSGARSKLRKPFRVCHLTSVHPVLDIRIFIKECCSLTKAGYDVTLIARYKRNEEVINDIQIIGVPECANRLLRMTYVVFKIFKKAKEIDADLYHFHDPELIPAGLLLKVLGYKVIYDSHEDTPKSLLGGRDYMPNSLAKATSCLIEAIENLAAKHFSAVIAATPSIEHRFKRSQPNSYNINNYPFTNELQPTIQPSWGDRELAVAYVGIIDWNRGLHEMIEAIGLISEQSGVRLKLAGKFSSERSRLIAKRLSGWACVDEMGYLGRQELACMLSTVRAGLVIFHPSPNHTEAQPNKLFEYMSAGLPVIASDFPLWREIIEKSKCGLCCNPLRPESIAEAVQWIMHHSEEARIMGENGRMAIIEKFSWESESKKLIALYNEILQEI
jgi:glycosyltransferase involved in cell wall biosynthesis